MSKARQLADLGNVYDDGALSNRNLIINGAMQVWQRGTSSSSAGYSTVDRYEMSGTSTKSRSTDAPDGFQYSLQQDLTAGNANQAEQFIEAANAVQLKGKTATLSFYAKATGSVEMYLYASTFSSVDNSSSKSFFVSNQTIGNATSSWVRYTVEIDFSAQANVVNGCGILIGFRETGGSTATAYLTGVQLEVGDTATPFEHRSYGEELHACQRYYIQGGGGAYADLLGGQGFNITTTLCSMKTYLPVVMRAQPTFSYTGTPRVQNGQSGYALSNLTGGFPSGNEGKVNMFNMTGTSSGLTLYQPMNLDANAGGGFVKLDAEL